MPLTVVPTPIGNLEDITLRALRVLREADLIACEDTRRTGRLLAHYEIKQDLIAYHEHNEERLASGLAERAKTERIALVTDAGTPLVSDPGYRLVRACIEAGVEIEALPGPSALTTALVTSGLPADTVVFAGFPPRKGRERKRAVGPYRDRTIYLRALRVPAPARQDAGGPSGHDRRSPCAGSSRSSTRRSSGEPRMRPGSTSQGE